MSTTAERVPTVTSIEPPKLTRAKSAIHTPEILDAIAKGAAKGWVSNGLTYKTKSGAQGALQQVKGALVERGSLKSTSDVRGRVWEQDKGEYVFAIAAKKAVDES